MRTLALALLMLVFNGMAANANVMLRGTPSCGLWIQERDRNRHSDASYLNGWLVGYLSGAAVHSNKDIIRGTDNASIEAWMDNYCRANPLMNLADGAEALFDELVKHKKL